MLGHSFIPQRPIFLLFFPDISQLESTKSRRLDAFLHYRKTPGSRGVGRGPASHAGARKRGRHAGVAKGSITACPSECRERSHRERTGKSTGVVKTGAAAAMRSVRRAGCPPLPRRFIPIENRRSTGRLCHSPTAGHVSWLGVGAPEQVSRAVGPSAAVSAGPNDPAIELARELLDLRLFQGEDGFDFANGHIKPAVRADPRGLLKESSP